MQRDWFGWALIAGAVSVIILCIVLQLKQVQRIEREKAARRAAEINAGSDEQPRPPIAPPDEVHPVATSAAEAARDAALVKYEMPTADGIQHGDYISAWDGMTRSPRWVLEMLTAKSLKQKVSREGDNFKVDPSIPEEFMTSAADYARSPFDIGHMAPADNHRSSQESEAATFLFSNACPQLANFNRGKWKMLEAYVQSLVTSDVTAVYVVTVPMWRPVQDTTGKKPPTLEVTCQGPHWVWVASDFGKVVLIEGPNGPIKMRAWILPHEADNPHPLTDFEVSADYFEAAAGLDVFAGVEDTLEVELEAAFPPARPVP